ncbi:hypothetical protein GCM10027271_18400 [Saccharopolyspora gloriosae]|uniref:Uncharacterized protein n=1 Tax=Saccharopolyspora gloriosae TaxID=455344 RepID=A0A840N5Y3_9PSEU|nr:hypothetical protein [Saccharopolyspora gloriosae]MBB5067390.1 hypothetical protein [Saccharopolyspora gloriosae]
MFPTVHFALTGRSLLVLLGLVVGALLVLAGVWVFISPGYAIGGGLALILLVRGAIALITPSNPQQ